MKNIIFFSKRETFKISYPNWLDIFILKIIKHIKIKTIKTSKTRGMRIKGVIYDEVGSTNYKAILKKGKK